jgi:hypothetical protein
MLATRPGQDSFWVDAESLLWWIKSNPVHLPLVTSGAAGDTSPGAIGQPGTTVLIGNENVDPGMFPGGRFTAGYWFGSDNTFGIEGGYFFLSSRTPTENVASDGSPTSRVLANPFFNAVTGKEDSSLIAFPGLLSGTAALSITSQMQGAELNTLFSLIASPVHRRSLLVGFRWLELHEQLGLSSHSVGVPGGADAGLSSSQNDVFDTRNNFYGGQIGLEDSWSFRRFFIVTIFEVALGAMQEVENVSGTPGTVLTVPVPTEIPEIYATTTNIGQHSHQSFGVVGEIDVTLGYQVIRNLSLTVGYSLLLVSDVLRPGDQIDHVINPSQFTGPLVGPARPQVIISESFFWAQGISVGAQLRF